MPDDHETNRRENWVTLATSIADVAALLWSNRNKPPIPSDQPRRQMTLAISNIHKSLYDAIVFAKKQQWAITNYVLLIYGAIFGVAKYIGQTPSTSLEKTVLALAALVAGAYAVGLLVVIQNDLGEYRKQLIAIYKDWLSEDERRIIEPGKYPNNPMLRGIWFLVALVGVVIFGLALLIYSLFRCV